MRELAASRHNSSSPGKFATEEPKGLGAAFRTHACFEFHFSLEKSYCQLMPLRNHWAALGLEHLFESSGSAQAANVTREFPQPQSSPSGEGEKEDSPAAAAAAKDLPTLSRWLSWLGDGTRQGRDWLKQQLSGGVSAIAISEADHYELDWEQVFIAQRNKRLVLRGSGDQTQRLTEEQDDETWIDGTQPQVRFLYYSLDACAKKCLQLKWCRSFDIKLASSQPLKVGPSVGILQRTDLCLLNIISVADLDANPSAWPSFELVQQTAASSASSSASSAAASGGGGEWWHYEPSELALFMITDPSEVSSLA